MYISSFSEDRKLLYCQYAKNHIAIKRLIIYCQYWRENETYQKCGNRNELLNKIPNSMSRLRSGKGWNQISYSFQILDSVFIIFFFLH